MGISRLVAGLFALAVLVLGSAACRSDTATDTSRDAGVTTAGTDESDVEGDPEAEPDAEPVDGGYYDEPMPEDPAPEADPDEGPDPWTDEPWSDPGAGGGGETGPIELDGGTSTDPVGGEDLCDPACSEGLCGADDCSGTCVPCEGLGGAEPDAPEPGGTDPGSTGTDPGAWLAGEDPDALFVLSDNVENLPEPFVDEVGCAGDWRDLHSYLSKLPRPPDLVLLQQVTNREQASEIALTLQVLTQVGYRVIVSQRNPSAWSGAQCTYKKLQSNVILYREDRLAYVEGSKRVWRSKISDQGRCRTSNLSRYRNVAAKFIDKRAPGRRVVAASVHWPVTDGCGVTNATLTHHALKAYKNADVLVFGGDLNLPDLVRPANRADLRNAPYMAWFKRLNASLRSKRTLGYRDAVWLSCQRATASTPDLKDCLGRNTTMSAGAREHDSMRRYDYVFARYANGYRSQSSGGRPRVTSGHTITFAEASAADAPDDSDLGYSEHRAAFGFIHW